MQKNYKPNFFEYTMLGIIKRILDDVYILPSIVSSSLFRLPKAMDQNKKTVSSAEGCR